MTQELEFIVDLIQKFIIFKVCFAISACCCCIVAISFLNRQQEGTSFTYSARSVRTPGRPPISAPHVANHACAATRVARTQLHCTTDKSSQASNCAVLQVSQC